MELIKGILIAVFCSSIALALHITVSLFRKGRQIDEPVIFELKRQAKLSLAIWGFILLLYACLFFLSPEWIVNLASKLHRIEELLGYAYGIFLYLTLCFIYLTIYYLADRSVSATILEIIENLPEGKAGTRQIKELYGIENKYRAELKGMQEGGFIIEEASYYRNSLKGHLYARLAWITKIIFKLGVGG